MAAVLPKLAVGGAKVAQSVATSGLRRAGNYSQKSSESKSKPQPVAGQGGHAMFRFLGGGGGDGPGPGGAGEEDDEEEEPLLLWRGVNLTYRGVPTLCDCGGSVARGEFAIVVGPGGGSDRVALLDVLSGRAVSGSVEGEFGYAGRRFAKEHLYELSTYVPQESSFLAGQEKGDSTSLQRGCSRSNAREKSIHALSSSREMIARPKMSQIEWKTIEI